MDEGAMTFFNRAISNYGRFRESSFNMTKGRGIEDIEGEAPKIFRHPKGALKKLGRAPEIFILQNQQEKGSS